MYIVKAYTTENGLIKSKKIFNESHLHAVLLEAIDYLKASKIFLTNNKKSSEITFHYKPLHTRPDSYTRPDGTIQRTLSIHPHNYPLKACYADGRNEVIKL